MSISKVVSAAVLVVSLSVAAAGQEAEPVNDHAIINSITEIGGQIADGGKAVSGKTLIEQLSKTKASLELPKKAPSVNGGPDDVYSTAKKATVVMAGIYKCDKCSKWHPNCASGFIVSPDGLVVTNYHVVNQPNNAVLVAMLSDGRILKVMSVEASSRQDDVAILRLDLGSDAKNLPYLGVAKSPAPAGADAFCLSHPEQQFYTFTRGMVSRYARYNNGGEGDRMVITTDYARGSSGGPILNSKAQVIGLVSSTRSIYYSEQDKIQRDLQMVLHFCVPASSIWKLLSR